MGETTQVEGVEASLSKALQRGRHHEILEGKGREICVKRCVERWGVGKTVLTCMHERLPRGALNVGVKPLPQKMEPEAMRDGDGWRRRHLPTA